MKKHLLLFVSIVFFSVYSFSQEREFEFEKDTVKFNREMLPAKYQVDTRIDNMGYWKRMAEAGLVPVAPMAKAPAPVYKTSKIVAKGYAAGDSPDVPVTVTNTTQSENSVFVSPSDPALIINSNNSTPQPSTGAFNGADALYSTDTAATWEGTANGPTGGNSGDPTTAINNNGRWFVGYINSALGQSVAYSDNQGASWVAKVVAPAPSGSGNMLDKNHMGIDNSITSPYNGYLYNGWTTFGGTNDREIGISRSIDAGLTWKPVIHVSAAANAGSHNQGVNIRTGPNGEVYAAWAIYDSWGPSLPDFGESAIGFARSTDGGENFNPAIRAITNIQGIRNNPNNPTVNITGKTMRVNSFPSMAVDISGGVNNGAIYIVWTNTGYPGENTGNDPDIYLIKSTDQGSTWSAPIRINQDSGGVGIAQYFAWITCDPETGNLAVIFYDDRNVGGTQLEVFVAVSSDGGETWSDFRVSDVASTPSPIANMAGGYMGDYLAIAVQDGVAYPTWTDTRSGHAMTYVSPFYLAPVMNQAYIAYQDNTLNDLAFGNNNGTPDYGENLLLTLAVKNIGDRPDTNVMVTLSCESPLVTFSDSTEDYGNFEIGEIKSIADAFAFHIADSIANGTELVFHVKAVNNIDSVNYTYFTLTASAPELTISNVRINDPSGNNNHILDPGEAADVVITYTNNSQFYATHPVSYLTSAQSFITIENSPVSMPIIIPGLTDSAVFHVTVADIPFGSAAQFTNKVDYSFQSSQKSFIEPIGLIVEDWESATMTKFPWTFSGTDGWELDNSTMWEGSYSARSKAISHNQTASLNLTYNVIYDDSISFYRKVSSEMLHDVMSFYIDNLKVGQWTGNQNWKRFVYPVLAGEHTFRWEYAKDAGTSTGQDAAWVDFIVLPPENRTMVFAGNNMNSCENLPVQMNATATNYQSLVWSTSGSGTFSDNSVLNPVYLPSASDVVSGTVTLTLSVTGYSHKESAQSSFVLTLNQKATVLAGSDETVCEGTSVTLSQPTATFYSTLNWNTSGDGIFSDPAILTPNYTPGSNDLATGSVSLFLTAITGNACPSVTDTLILAVHPLPQAGLNIASEICYGDSTQLTYTMSGTAPFNVVFESGETRNVPASTWAEWVKPLTNTIYTIQSVTDANGCTGTTPATTSILVKPAPVVSMTADTNLCGNLTLNLSANAQGAVSYLWTPGNFTTPTISIDTVGSGLGTRTFTLVATAANGCATSAKSLVTFVNCTGIEEMVGNVGFALYPNPNKGQFAIEFKSKSREEISLRVINTTGATVYSLNNLAVTGTMTREFDLRNLADGTYLLVLENNKMQITRQLIITK